MKHLHRILIATIILFPILGFAEEEKLPQILFKNINIFNGTENKLYENHQVLVEGNLIRAISASAIETRDGVTAMEGMRWDEIASRAAAQAQEWLADGFTTVRDMGGMAA